MPGEVIAIGKRRTCWDYNEMGAYFYSRGAYDLAVSELERAVKTSLVPVAAFHVNLGAAYLAKKRCAEARASLERGLAIDPDSQKGHAFLARLLEATGALPEAIAEFERARAIDPESAEGEVARQAVAHLRAAISESRACATRRPVPPRAVGRAGRRPTETSDDVHGTGP